MNPYNEYEKNEVITADRRQLVIMLYSGAINFLEMACTYIHSYKTYDKANSNILRAQDILTELMVSLDMEKGQEIAQNLLSLYTFMKKELIQANIEKKKDRLLPVIKMLSELKYAWEQIGNTSQLPTGNSIPPKKTGFSFQG